MLVVLFQRAQHEAGEYLRLRSEGDSRLLVELFTMLKRSGADQIITYAATDIARCLR